MLDLCCIDANNNMYLAISVPIQPIRWLPRLFSWGVRVSNDLPGILVAKLNAAYSDFAKDLKSEQKSIHSLTISDAAKDKRRYEYNLRVLSIITDRQITPQAKAKPLFETVMRVERILKENVFLMDLVINGELEKGDVLSDLLEDFYDGVTIREKSQLDQYVPWEVVKKELDVKHGLV